MFACLASMDLAPKQPQNPAFSGSFCERNRMMAELSAVLVKLLLVCTLSGLLSGINGNNKTRQIDGNQTAVFDFMARQAPDKGPMADNKRL